MKWPSDSLGGVVNILHQRLAAVFRIADETLALRINAASRLLSRQRRDVHVQSVGAKMVVE